MEPVRLGIIGCGVISNSHLDLAGKCPLAEAVAVADVIEERAKAMAEKYGVSSYYSNEDDLLNDEQVEAVILAMPSGVRTSVALKALAKGKHVLLEKPVACNAAEVEKMIELRGDKVVACCSPRMSFTGHAEAAAKCVASGALGKIRVVRFRAIGPAGANPNPNPPPWRQNMKLNGGGILVNWSCYDLNYLMHIVDWQLEPTAVFAKWWPVAEKMFDYAGPGSDADSHFIALIQCRGNAVLSMERAEFSSSTGEQAWEIIGTEGTLHLPMRPPTGRPNAVILEKFVPGEGVVSETIWEEGDGDPGGDVIQDFVHAIREGGQPRATLERSLVLQKITDGIYASSETGASVAIS